MITLNFAIFSRFCGFTLNPYMIVFIQSGESSLNSPKSYSRNRIPELEN